jgi:hypothetical protein
MGNIIISSVLFGVAIYIIVWLLSAAFKIRAGSNPVLTTKQKKVMKPTEVEFQRVGLLSVLSQFAINPNVDVVTQLSIKEATLKILNEHPIGDHIEKKVRSIMR